MSHSAPSPNPTKAPQTALEEARLLALESRAGRLNHALETVVKHDLPNTLVALRGMLGMLEAEDKERLSPAGQDCLHRLLGIADKMQQTVETLRTIHTIGHRPFAPERQPVSEAFAEGQQRVKQLHPFVSFLVTNELDDQTIVAPPTMLATGFAEGLSLTAKVVGSPEIQCLVSCRRFGASSDANKSAFPSTPGRLQVILSAAGSASVDLRQGDSAESDSWDFDQPIDYDCFGKDLRMQLILVDEIIRTCGGSVVATILPNQVCQIRFLLCLGDTE